MVFRKPLILSILLILIEFLTFLTPISPVVHAAPVVVDFEKISAGTVVNNQYQNLGVTFNSATAVDYSSLGAGFAHSGTIAIEQCYNGAEFCSTPIEMTFTTAQHRVKVWVGYSARLLASRAVDLTVLDALGNNIGSATKVLTSNASPSPIQNPLEVSTSGDIHSARVNFAPADVTYHLAVDDVEFDTQLVPPTTLACSVAVDRVSGTAPLFVSFQGLASGGAPPYLFSWDFGDGNSNKGDSTSYQYLYPGSFLATLTVTGSPSGQVPEVTTCSVQISVSQPTPFNDWETTHCTGSNTPKQHLSVAFVPAKYLDDTGVHLTRDQIMERANWIKEYFFQQSMCHVVITPTVVQGPASGWFTLPKTKASYDALTPSDEWKTVAAITTWNDAVGAAKPSGSFDAIVVIDTISLAHGGLRSRAVITEPIAKSGQAQAVIDLVVVTLAPALGPVLPVLYSQGLLQQGSVITSDEDSTETWAHELGHALFGFWDLYGTVESFVRGNTSPWGLMSSSGRIPVQPISVFEKAQQGWLQYHDINWHDTHDDFRISTTPHRGATETYLLTPMGDLKYGATIPRLGVYREVGCPACHRRNVVDWYIFELRNAPDGVPPPPEQKLAVPDKETSITGLVVYAKREYHADPFGVGYFFPDCGAIPGWFTPFVEGLLGGDFKSCYDSWIGTPDGAADTAIYLKPGQCFTDKNVDVQWCLENDGRTLKLSDPVKSTTVVNVDINYKVPGTPTSPGDLVTGRTDFTVPVDLNVYASTRAHVGPNYQTGAYDVAIPGAAVGWAHSPFQWISIPDNFAASFVIDGSTAVRHAKDRGLNSLDVNATLTILHYDAKGNMTIVQQPTLYKLNFDKPSATGNIAPTVSPSSPAPPANPLSPYLLLGIAALAAVVLVSAFLVLRSRRRHKSTVTAK